MPTSDYARGAIAGALFMFLIGMAWAIGHGQGRQSCAITEQVK